jgi:hypothetical protein
MSEILIDNDISIETIQDGFRKHFPFLKLIFYKTAHETAAGSQPKDEIDSTLTIGEVRSKDSEGHISINGHKKVSTLETEFREHYGLNVQVFRKSRKIWLQTTATDSWTLTEQNERGKEASID